MIKEIAYLNLPNYTVESYKLGYLSGEYTPNEFPKDLFYRGKEEELVFLGSPGRAMKLKERFGGTIDHHRAYAGLSFFCWSINLQVTEEEILSFLKTL